MHFAQFPLFWALLGPVLKSWMHHSHGLFCNYAQSFLPIRIKPQSLNYFSLLSAHVHLTAITTHNGGTISSSGKIACAAMLSVCRKDVIFFSCMKCHQPSHSALHHLPFLCAHKMNREHNLTQSFVHPPPTLSLCLSNFSVVLCCLSSSVLLPVHLFPESWQSVELKGTCVGLSRMFAIHPHWGRQRGWNWKGGKTVETLPGRMDCAVNPSRSHTCCSSVPTRTKKTSRFIREKQASAALVRLFIMFLFWTPKRRNQPHFIRSELSNWQKLFYVVW